jgi:hypothetical protein
MKQLEDMVEKNYRLWKYLKTDLDIILASVTHFKFLARQFRMLKKPLVTSGFFYTLSKSGGTSLHCLNSKGI